MRREKQTKIPLWKAQTASILVILYIFCTPVWLNYEKQEEFIKEICRRKSTKSLRRAGNEGRRNNDNEYARIANRKQGKTP